MAHTTAHNTEGATSRAAHAARVNVSQESCREKAVAHDQRDGEDLFCRPSPLQTLQFQVAGDFQQPMRLNRNAEHRRRRRARRQQLEDAAEAVCSANPKCEVYTRIFLKQHKDRVFVPERESRVLQQRKVRVIREVRVKREACAMSVSEHEARASTKLDDRVLTQRKVLVSPRKFETRVQPKSPHPRG